MEFDLQNTNRFKKIDLDQPSTKHKKNNKIIVVGSSGKGGTGKTTVSINTALMLSDLGLRVALLDFDIPYGDVAEVLGVSNNRNLSDWLLSDNVFVDGPNGIKVIPAIENERDLKHINNAFFVKNVISKLSDFDAIVIDAGPNIEEMTLESYKQATDIILVSDSSEVSLKNINRGVEHLVTHRIDLNNVSLMINRITKHNRLNRDECRLISGVRHVYELSYEPKMINWLEAGEFPVLERRRTMFTKSLYNWAKELLPYNPNFPAMKKAFFFSWGRA